MSSSNAVDLSLGEVDELEAVVDREALRDLCRSFYELFGISIRVLSSTGALLADVHEEQAVCQYMNSLDRGRSACAKTVGVVKDLDSGDETVIHPCFTGAVYRVVAIQYQGRQVGRFVLGPYLPLERTAVPRSLLAVDPDVDPEKAQEALAQMPRVREETAQRISDHLRQVVDLVLFSRHRALLTSEMHVASVRESYRELAEKTSELQKAYEELRELDKLKSSFLATVSHELRTPLTSILGYSEMLVSGIAGKLESEQQEFVETIRSKGEHLLALITNLLDLSKLERAQIVLNRESVDVTDLLREVETTAGLTAKRKEVEFSTRIEGEVQSVTADPVRLRQVLFNLADNAVKFTPTGGSVSVTAKAVEVDDGAGGMGAVLMSAPEVAVCFEITDSGIGIPEDVQARIFDAFYQVDGTSTREHGGAGLGLSIVKKLVEAHGGTIDVQSSLGQGTTFHVTLPENDSE